MTRKKKKTCFPCYARRWIIKECNWVQWPMVDCLEATTSAFSIIAHSIWEEEGKSLSWFQSHNASNVIFMDENKLTRKATWWWQTSPQWIAILNLMFSNQLVVKCYTSWWKNTNVLWVTWCVQISALSICAHKRNMTATANLSNHRKECSGSYGWLVLHQLAVRCLRPNKGCEVRDVKRLSGPVLTRCE